MDFFFNLHKQFHYLPGYPSEGVQRKVYFPEMRLPNFSGKGLSLELVEYMQATCVTTPAFHQVTVRTTNRMCLLKNSLVRDGPRVRPTGEFRWNYRAVSLSTVLCHFYLCSVSLHLNRKADSLS